MELARLAHARVCAHVYIDITLELMIDKLGRGRLRTAAQIKTDRVRIRAQLTSIMHDRYHDIKIMIMIMIDLMLELAIAIANPDRVLS